MIDNVIINRWIAWLVRFFFISIGLILYGFFVYIFMISFNQLGDVGLLQKLEFLFLYVIMASGFFPLLFYIYLFVYPLRSRGEFIGFIFFIIFLFLHYICVGLLHEKIGGLFLIVEFLYFIFCCIILRKNKRVS